MGNRADPTMHDVLQKSGVGDFWRECRYNSGNNSTQVRGNRQAYSHLIELLQAGCGIVSIDSHHHRTGPGRSTPSAGGLYPFDIIVGLKGPNNQLGLFAYDPWRNQLLSYGDNKSDSSFDEFWRCLRVGDQSELVETVIIVMSRPWVSMKKYGMRGYHYCGLDCAHAAANLALYAETFGYKPFLTPHIDYASAIALMQLDGSCRVPAFGVILEQGDGKLSDCWIDHEWLDNFTMDQPGQQEIKNWEKLQGFGLLGNSLTLSSISATSPVCDPERKTHSRKFPILEVIGSRSTTANLRRMIYNRYSAGGFLNIPVSSHSISKIVDAAVNKFHLVLSTNNSRSLQLHLKLVAFNVDGLKGVYAHCQEQNSLLLVGQIQSQLSVVDVCMKQSVVENAAALIILYTSIDNEFAHDAVSVLPQIQMEAAAIAQSLYLEATTENIGITSIGAFDYELCRQLAHINEAQEPVYILAIGTPDQSSGATKIDAELPVAKYESRIVSPPTARNNA